MVAPLYIQCEIFFFSSMPKPLTVWITIYCGTFFKRWEYQTSWPASWETCMQVRKQQLDLDMEQQTGSKSGKEYVKAVYCHPAYLTYMQSTSWEGNGNPLQCSCLENPRDGGAWWAAVYGVAQSRTWLKRHSSSSSSTSWGMLGWKKHKLESDCREKYQ